MGYKGSFLADEIITEKRERERWKRYAERVKKLKEEEEKSKMGDKDERI